MRPQAAGQEHQEGRQCGQRPLGRSIKSLGSANKSGSDIRLVAYVGAKSRVPFAKGREVSRMTTKNNYASLSQPYNIPIPILFLGDERNVNKSPSSV